MEKYNNDVWAKCNASLIQSVQHQIHMNIRATTIILIERQGK